MGKNIGCRKFLLQTLCCLVGIRGKRRDVDKRCNSRVGAGRRDDRTTIGMTDQDRGVADTAQSSLHAVDIAGVRIKTVLGSDYFKSFLVAIRLTHQGTIPSIWRWKIIRETGRNSTCASPQRRRAASICCSCGGRKGFVVRRVGGRKVSQYGRRHWR